MRVQTLFSLEGQVALITGGSRGLGRKIAEALGELGAKLVIVARTQSELTAAVHSLRDAGVDATGLSFDLSGDGDIAGLVDSAIEAYGRIDILVNNAGTSWAQPAEEHSLEGWRKVMTLNVDVAFNLSREVGRREMIPRGAGKIVNIASVGGLRGNRPEHAAYTLAYSTSKGALVNFTRALACEWGRYGVNVNALCPGFFRSKLADHLLERIETSLLEATPLKRIGTEDDFKGAAAFLCSAASQHMTGQVLVIDGWITAC